MTVRRIELIPLGAHVVMIVVVASNGVIKNKAYRLDMICAPEILDFFNKFANDRFADRSIDEISTGYLNSVAVALGEYSRVFHNSAYDLLTLLENRALLQDALEGPENQTLNIKIGKENHLAQLENSTVLVARYNVGQDNTGVIGVIGPVRMDYSKLIPHLEYFSQTLGRLLGETLEEQK